MSTPDEIEIEIVLRHLAVVKFEPGDTLVFRYRHSLSESLVSRLKQATESLLPGVRCMVVGDGAELSVLRGLPEPKP